MTTTGTVDIIRRVILDACVVEEMKKNKRRSRGERDGIIRGEISETARCINIKDNVERTRGVRRPGRGRERKRERGRFSYFEPRRSISLPPRSRLKH